MKPLISCIVPAHDSEPWIGQALESILTQQGPPIEVIVVDDGSSDGTAAVASRHAGVRVVRVEDVGPAAARNRGVSEAQGNFLAFLDADDLWTPGKLSRQMAVFERSPGTDLCIGHVQLFWPEGSAEAERYRDHPRARPVPGYATTTLLARRAAFEAVGPFDERLWFSDATEWFVRARDMALQLEVLPDVLVMHRMHGGNLTRRRTEESKDEFLELARRALDARRKGVPR